MPPREFQHPAGHRRQQLPLDFAGRDAAEPTDPQESKALRRIGWASLLARVFAVDVTVSRKCGGRMRVLEVVGTPDAVAHILHGARAPPRPPPPGTARSSAVLATSSLARWVPDAAVDRPRVERLILLTARHGHLDAATLDVDEAHFLDCDMAILGAAPERFDAYDRGIAREYAAPPAEAYAAGRSGRARGARHAPP
jgi:hypothetical protein